jgi:hypothetical protein
VRIIRTVDSIDLAYISTHAYITENVMVTVPAKTNPAAAYDSRDCLAVNDVKFWDIARRNNLFLCMIYIFMQNSPVGPLH